ncbi:hypothetical protein FGO68_gene10319 [Halteria grandinella]|uniref:RING-type domain-containing protein n=1 Tax=Halteria grandinella TaxID=5974 RepID=A0A8J8SVF1_HALGN|nr:hypothetical protein FGO68_gene10319 [Halteria grandinella]
MNAEELQIDGSPAQQSHVISESKESVTTMHNERCAVCFDNMLKNDLVKVLTCSHYYHIECIDQWLLVEKRCPMCMMYLDGTTHGEKKQPVQ